MKLKLNKLTLLPQVALIFFTVSGGAYGLESLVGSVGPQWAVLLLVCMPFVWAAPIGLMVAELASSLPQQGGFYVWVRRGLGDFWGFQEGWWTICYSAADMALYPVLFVQYLSFFFPSLRDDAPGAFWIRWGLCSAFVFSGLLSNLRGSYAVGRQATINMAIVMLPFLAILVQSAFSGNTATLTSGVLAPALSSISPAQLAAGLAIVLWNFCGWENISTYANEVEDPQRVYPKAILFAMVLITLGYLLPLLAGLSATVAPQDWSESSGWPAIAEKLGGERLGIAVAAAALVSTWAMFNSQVLFVSRLPAAMAQDGWMPRSLAQVSPRTGAPTRALIWVCLAAAAFSALSLERLMVVDILFYALGLSLEFAALVALRLREPGLARPFRIPLKTGGLIAMSGLPVALAVTVACLSTLGEEGSLVQVGVVAIGVLAGLAIYGIKSRVSPAVRV